jgi:2-haloacid dehalogenase
MYSRHPGPEKRSTIGRMTSTIKAIVYDFGGVLLDWDPRSLYRRFFPGNPEGMEQFLAETGFMEWNAWQDKGRPFSEGIALLADEFPQHSHLIRIFRENWEETVTGEIPGASDLLARLKQKGYPRRPSRSCAIAMPSSTCSTI